MFIVHQNELLRQTSEALWKQHLEHGIIAAGKRPSNMAAQVASVQTLVRRLHRYHPPDLIVIDEAHRAAANTYQRVVDAYPTARVIGLTATPERTDGKALSDLFSDLVEGPTIRQLIDAGYLSEYDIVAPPSSALTLDGVHTRGGDYDRGELEEAVDKPTITGDAVAQYAKHARGKRCVVMCVSIKHATHVRDQYLSAGIKAEMIEGGMGKGERDAAMQRFRDGETHVLTNVQLMVEGVDIPMIEVVQWLRPTQSLVIWMQGNGRGLRPAPGKDRLLILDHVSNWTRHGLPDEDREWSMEGKKGRKRKADDDEAEVHVVQCVGCFHIFAKGPELCPKCGEPLPKKGRPELEVVEGELEKIDIDAIRRERKREQGQARSIKDLIELGVRRNMNRPAEWAAITNAARQRRKPTAAEFAEAKRIYAEVKLG